MNEEKIYRLDDDISFRMCSLSDGKEQKRGNCTSFYLEEENFHRYYRCRNDGVHLHCTKHPEIELDIVKTETFCQSVNLICPKCKNKIRKESLDAIYKKCLIMLNIETFKGAKLIRLDDWYTPELKEKIEKVPNYWIKSDIKTDKDGDTIIVLYIGHKDSKEKVQFFIKPEKGQLSNDHNDLAPSNLLTKIQVTLKDKTITHDYE